MEKIGKPRSLISYSTLRDYNHNMAIATGGTSGAIHPARVYSAGGRLVDGIRLLNWHVFIRPRVFIYVVAWCAIALGMLFLLLTRDRLELNVLHDRNPIAVTLSDGSIRNGYTIKLLNMIPEPRTITLSIEGLPGATLSIAGMPEATGRSADIPVEPDRLRSLHVFVSQLPQFLQKGQRRFQMQASDRQSFEIDRYEATFDVP
jgi:polyferredoxin